MPSVRANTPILAWRAGEPSGRHDRDARAPSHSGRRPRLSSDDRAQVESVKYFPRKNDVVYMLLSDDRGEDRWWKGVVKVR